MRVRPLLTSPFPTLARVAASVLAVGAAHADITWTGAVSRDIFDEANWDLTQSGVTVVDPSVGIPDNVVIRNAPAPVEIPEVGGAGQLNFQVSETYRITIDNSRVVALGNDGIACDANNVVGIDVEVVNGASFEPFFVFRNVRVRIDGTSTAVFGGGGNPINVSTVDLTLGATLRFLLEDPTEYTNEHLVKTTVQGQPAVIGVNLSVVSDGAQGSIVTVLPQTLGTSYCTANPSSTGVPAAMSATGSASAAANDVRLRCAAMPNNSFAFFLTSLTRSNVANPGGSQGVLCLGGAIGRYVGPGQIQNSGATGAVTLQLSLTSHPTPTGPVAVMAGQTWNFQCWFRDVSPGGTASSNFSNGLTIVFN